MVRRLSLSLISSIAMIAALAATPASAQQAPALSPPEPLKVANAIESRWMANYNSGNAAGIARMFAADGSFATGDGTMLNGPAAIEKFNAAALKAGWTKVTTSVLSAHAAGNAVWILGDYTLASGRYDGKQIEGRYLKVVTPQGGQWRIRTLVANIAPPVR